MRPPPVWRIHMMDNLQSSAGASRLICMVSRQAAQSLSAIVPMGPWIPALLIRMSRRGQRRWASFRMACGADGWLRSIGKAWNCCLVEAGVGQVYDQEVGPPPPHGFSDDGSEASGASGDDGCLRMEGHSTKSHCRRFGNSSLGGKNHPGAFHPPDLRVSVAIHCKPTAA